MMIRMLSEKNGDYGMALRGKKYLKKIISVMCAMTTVCVLLTGCQGKKDENGSMKAEDGRLYGGLIEAKVGEEVNTSFFDVEVKEVAKYETYQFEDGLYQAEEGKTYLVVTLKIKNTYPNDLSMSSTDFTLDYEGNSSEEVITGYGKSDIGKDEFMENVYTLKKGDEITKSILFVVEDKEDYTLNYTEFYEDNFEGNKFKITMQPKKVVDETSTTEEKKENKK